MARRRGYRRHALTTKVARPWRRRVRHPPGSADSQVFLLISCKPRRAIRAQLDSRAMTVRFVRASGVARSTVGRSEPGTYFVAGKSPQPAAFVSRRLSENSSRHGRPQWVFLFSYSLLGTVGIEISPRAEPQQAPQAAAGTLSGGYPYRALGTLPPWRRYWCSRRGRVRRKRL